MKIVTLKDMIRKDVPIYYRMLYTSVAVIEFNNKQNDYRIDFSLEIKPTGAKEVNVTFIDAVDYPLVPVIRELKRYIIELDNADGLPT
jgi:2-methylaconitate cis-trans-isomerase PrpF